MMRFQAKILLAYMTIVVIVISVISSIFYLYNANQFKVTAHRNMQETADRIARQIDYQITYMDSTLENLMSDADFMDAIRIKGGPAPVSARDNELYIASDRIITSALYRYPLNKYIYRVNYFNHNFDFFSSRFNNRDTVNKGSEEIFAKIQWLSKVDEIHPKRYISVMHDDQWLKSGENTVFSIIRNIRFFSVDAGYLEVQMESSKLQEMLNITAEVQRRIVLVTPSGETLFHNLSENHDPEFYLSFLPGISEIKEDISGKRVNEFVASTICTYSGIKVFLIEDQDIMLAPQAEVGMIAFVISFGLLFVAFFYVYTWSVRLTKPIRTLRREMKRIELSDLTENEHHSGVPEPVGDTKDDIKELNNTFYNLFNRLSSAIKNELKARELQTQANFDFLQAQINPHFIYNVLNVISIRGLAAGDEQICDICASIAQMLRYSTSTVSKIATVSDEIAHVKNYLMLLQTRYEHRLRYSIDIEPDLMSIKMPKIVLQPFVENSVTHGYKKGTRDMEISITGISTKNGWMIKIQDNGDGFDNQTLKNIHDTICSVDSQLSTGEGILRLSLGGMGIAGTYARLKILQPNICLSIDNNLNSGAYVLIELKS